MANKKEIKVGDKKVVLNSKSKSSNSDKSINKENTLYLKKCTFGLNLL